VQVQLEGPEAQVTFQEALPSRCLSSPLRAAYSARLSHLDDQHQAAAVPQDDVGAGAGANDATAVCSQIYFSLHESLIIHPTLFCYESVQSVSRLIFFD